MGKGWGKVQEGEVLVKRAGDSEEDYHAEILGWEW